MSHEIGGNSYNGVFSKYVALNFFKPCVIVKSNVDFKCALFQGPLTFIQGHRKLREIFTSHANSTFECESFEPLLFLFPMC